MPPFSEHLHSLGNCNIRLAFDTGGRLPAKRNRPLVVVKRFKNRPKFLPNTPKKKNGKKIARYLHRFSIVVCSMLHEATVYRLISAQVTGKVGSMPIKWGGSSTKKSLRSKSHGAETG